jgi:Tc toxin complex TcA C-terminal TcB-binding domain
MKQELMKPEFAAQDFVKFNYWDGGRKGLLAGEALYLDVKRMEMAYHDNDNRELELTCHVSLQQLDPLALLTLKSTSTRTVTISK